MELSDFFTIFSTTIAIAALGYSYLQSKVKKYEVKRDYINHILQWYSDTITILINLFYLLKNDLEQFQKTKHTLLAKLSAQIEIGRFYFPNIDKGDALGKGKPRAYQGHRNVALEFLMDVYNICVSPKPETYLDRFEFAQREFTSVIFEIIDPHEIINETNIVAEKYYLKFWNIEEYLTEDPERLNDHLKWHNDMKNAFDPPKNLKID